ncbi:MAG: alanine racemase [Spirochaetales bacterium]|nr:alanine racemase [Spirochaetales bacterium]
MRPTRAIIHTDNFRHNIQLVRNQVGREKLVCVAIKADAYGHGANELCSIAIEEGVSYFAVATVGEGVSLRKNNLTIQIILLTLTTPEEFSEIISNGIQPFVADKAYIKGLNREAKKQGRILDIHLHVDSGMGRIGCKPEQAADLAKLIESLENVNMKGVSTHFACADEPSKSMTNDQITKFKEALEQIKSAGIDPGIVHSSNSAAIVGYSESWIDMVRPGIILYGYYPGHDQERSLDVKPVMEFRTEVVFLKRVKAGQPLSYGATYVTDRATVIATLPVGYGDGYNRLLSSKGIILINGKKYKVAGRVCMDQLLLDLGPDADVDLYDEAILFGEGPDAQTAEDLADMLDTISYEITCNVNKRVPRVYLP